MRVQNAEPIIIATRFKKQHSIVNPSDLIIYHYNAVRTKQKKLRKFSLVAVIFPPDTRGINE